MSETPSPLGEDGPASLPSDLAIWTSFLLWRTTSLAQEHIRETLASFGLRIPHNTVLTLLMSGPRTQVSLSDLTQTDRKTMVTLVDDLEQMGLVIRKVHPQDRRAHHVTLTAEGNALLERVYREVTATDTTFFAPLSSAEQAQFRSMLLRLLHVHLAEKTSKEELK